ncbi:MAG: hypothetical protein IJU16_03765, partial [Clostridia bacterium]|nr:hypothetical protein [Clostridia bacterium]
DVWILPDTEANRKTTVWGTATLSKLAKGDSRQAPLCEPGDDGRYLLRLIDTDGFYYSASGVLLKADWTLQISGSGLDDIAAEVLDESGTSQATYAMFAAKL